MTARPGSPFRFAVPGIGDAEQILKWRTSPRISAVMLSVVENDIERQRDWLAGVAARRDYFHWFIRLAGENIGIIAPAGTPSATISVPESVSYRVAVGGPPSPVRLARATSIVPEAKVAR